MGLPRKAYVKEGQEGVYHCFVRCVRRAFLCGRDLVTQRDFSHRKTWIVDRLRELAAIFGIEVCGYAIMENHYHVILRTRPDIVAAWSNREVARRWLTLFPHRDGLKKSCDPPDEKQIAALAGCAEQIAKWRKRLSSLSWFMGQINEYVARAANKEDGVKGRFWESRFKCLNLLDEAAIAAGMVYVDLNLIRAGLAKTPEDSEFTSIRERIRIWGRERSDTISGGQSVQSGSMDTGIPELEERAKDTAPVSNFKVVPALWLCPIQSDAEHRGILRMTESEYLDLVDRSGRILRRGKRGSIPSDLAPILLRIGANPEAWLDTISRFGSRFRLAAGLVSSLRIFAEGLNKRWFTGMAAARIAFATKPQWV
jgi:REP element-mobilizing transposase RayT